MKTLMQKKKTIEIEECEWREEKKIIERKNAILKEKINLFKSYLPKISTSKLLIAFLFINCTVIEIFAGWATVQMLTIAMINSIAIDFTPLVTLIGTVVGEVFGFAIYSLKAVKENTVGGIVYDQAMRKDSVG